MKRFVQVPNLPQGKVVVGIISGENKNVLKHLEDYGIKAILTQKNNFIDKSISFHADINAHHLGSNTFLIDPGQSELSKTLKELHADILETEEAVCGKYPFDCRLNFARVGNHLIGQSKVCSNALKEYCKAHAITMISVKQGYSKCSVCVVNEHSIITDDPSIKKAADAAELDCLLISKGDIRLNGHDYGFIGGAGTLIDRNKLMFFGDLTKHKDYKSIIRFCKERNCEIVFDETCPLTDIGGMIPVLEENS